MSAVFELIIFFGGLYACIFMIGRVCYEGGWDDYD